MKIKTQLKEIVFVTKILLTAIKENWLWILVMTTIYIAMLSLVFFFGALIVKFAWNLT